MIKLSNGVQIPQLGFGTYKVTVDEAYDSVRNALEVGYRHIDTAAMYGNEVQVGAAIADSGIDRDEIFITSKLNNPFHEPAAAREAFAQSLTDLQLEQIDLYLIHWPLARSTDYVATWRTLLEFEQDGRARAVGVSNFQPDHLQGCIEATGVAPRVNQVEIHPFNSQQPLVDLHNQLGIVTQSWSPLGRAQCLAEETIIEIAEETGRTPAQVIIRWHLQRGLVVIPKSVHLERMRSNFEVTDFALDAAQMARIDALNRDQRVGSHPDKVELA